MVAASLAVAVKLYVPSPSAVPNVSDQAPPLPEVVVPREVAPLNTSIVKPVSPEVPDIEEIGVFRDPAVGDAMTGAAGGVLSTTPKVRNWV